MEKQFYTIVGRSGCGKGTQAELLKEKLMSLGLENVKHISTGEGVREFTKGENYIATLSRYTNEQGLLQPEFLAVWNWSNLFINKIEENDSIILDGAPRKFFEIAMLNSAIKFMGFEKLTVIYLDVSESWARERLQGRGREDDLNENEVSRRMDWFETEVLPVIDAYKNDDRYNFFHINGEQTSEEVLSEIIEKLKL